MPGSSSRNMCSRGVGGAVPVAFREVLFAMHEEHMVRLSDYLPKVDYPRNWLRKYRSPAGAAGGE